MKTANELVDSLRGSNIHSTVLLIQLLNYHSNKNAAVCIKLNKILLSPASFTYEMMQKKKEKKGKKKKLNSGVMQPQSQFEQWYWFASLYSIK